MNVLLPYEDFAESAKCLDIRRMHAQYKFGVMLLRSITHVYKPRNKQNIHGFEDHTVAKFWMGHELALAKFMLALANEGLHRPLGPDKAFSLFLRKKRLRETIALVEYMESLGWPDTKPLFIGDEEFHSGTRAFLLYKEMQDITFRMWKRGQYPVHAITRNLLPRKSSWYRQTYITLWEFFGRPEPVHYRKFGWTEEPNDMLMFYTPDRISFMAKQMERKRAKPTSPVCRNAHIRRNYFNTYA